MWSANGSPSGYSSELRETGPENAAGSYRIPGGYVLTQPSSERV